MTSICFITAKGYSRRLPQKNVLKIGGKTLVTRAIEGALKSRCFTKICVSSDDAIILNLARQAGVDAIERGQELCTSDFRAKDVVYFHLNTMKERFDYVTLLMPTTPLRESVHIKEAHDLLVRKRAISLMSVSEYNISPGMAMKIVGGKLRAYYGKKLQWVREDIYPQGYHVNGAIYMARYDFFMKNRTFLSTDTVPYIMEQEAAVDVDTEDDLRLARLFYRSRK